MDLREALPILFCSNPKAKLMAYLLTLVLITIFAGGFSGFVFLLVPLGLDVYGAFLVKDNHKAFQEDVLENLEAECLRACGVTKAQPHYPFSEVTGQIAHWMLKELKADASVSVMAPKDDFVVIASRKGRIFPLRSYFPVVYHTEDAGTRDVYYSDISAVELSGKVLTMTTAAGEAVSYTGQGDKAAQAAEHIRNRLREFKSRRPLPEADQAG
ncbi:MAG TPA: hypothetical protein VN419_09325 [Humidesulfovibrio sp.]|uniref:hypothetical protein n=1 Tax=Humidesulfovibrio sp. TaxID=2910988 RepID=UPI002C8AB5DE|nr:hypothetical protein [Humidesulfovibrio sp.]HWR04208.1 hypothetical protein [Humidesulfovibrio sp.]